jgi:hypothetical protein
VAEEEFGRYGPLALYVGGAGEVHFKDVAYKDLAWKARPPEKVSSQFRMQRLSDFYYSWGAGAGDFNHDGILDVVSGPYIYYGPDYIKSREIYPAKTTNPSDAHTTDVWMQFAADFTGGGWPDVINANFSGATGVCLYVNPKGESRRRDKYMVIPAYRSEIGVLRDISFGKWSRPMMTFDWKIRLMAALALGAPAAELCVLPHSASGARRGSAHRAASCIAPYRDSTLPFLRKLCEP